MLRNVFLLLVLYGSACSCHAQQSYKDLSPAQFQSMMKTEEVIVIDVRTPAEVASGHIEGAINMDVRGKDFEKQINSLDKSKKYLVYCRSGSRSATALNEMEQSGFKSLYGLDGGILEWIEEGLPVVKD